MFGIMPLRGAYGRDYKSRGEILRDWEAGEDFQCSNGQYCSTRDFDEGQQITIRYDGLRKVYIFNN